MFRFPSLSILAMISAFLGFAAIGQAQAQADVVVSIKPIHSLVAGVMEGVGSPHLIVPGGASPHSYSLKPSDARALEKARVVFWVGEYMETFMVGPLKTLGKKAEIVELAEAPGLVQLVYRKGGAWEKHGHAHEDEHAAEAEHEHEHEEAHEHEHEHEEAHEHEHEGEHHAEAHDDHDEHHEHGEIDMHLWMDPMNAKAMTAQIVKALSKVDPKHKDTYEANGAKIMARLDALTAQLAKELASVREKPYIVFHDAYQYFEKRFGLNSVGSITVSPEIQPGAARLKEVREKIVQLGASCVFAEPQFEPKLVQIVIEGTGAKSGELDPVGADLPEGPDMYFDLMSRNAAALKSCLSTGS